MMARPFLHLRVTRRTAQGVESIENPLDRMLVRMVDLSPALRAVVQGWRRLILDYELSGRRWVSPSGRIHPWPPLSRLSQRSTEPLGAKVRTAWAGGAGGFTRVSSERAEFGVSDAAVPYLKYHRGGSGKLLESDIVGRGILVTSAAQVRPWKLTRGTRRWNHPQKWAIWWKFFFAFGITLSGRKLIEGLFTPFRPHASANPTVRTRATAILSAHIVGRPLPNFGPAPGGGA